MKNPLALILPVTLVLVALSAQAADDSRVWVVFKPGQKDTVKNQIQNDQGWIHYEFDDLEAIATTVPEAALDGLRNNPNVELVEEDPPRYLSGDTVPYGVDLVQARDLWDVNRDTIVDAGAPTGSGIKIGVIDSGVYAAHVDFSGVSISGYNSTGQVDWWSSDGYGHGTHVVGTIAAANNGLGVVGVTPGTVSIYMVKVFGDTGGWAYSSTLVDAAQRCKNAGAKVINMSLSGPSKSLTEERAFKDLYSKNGILSVASAGNGGTTQFNYPASYASVVSVAAIDQYESVAGFSQKNSQVELSAPGVGVLSTVPGGGYGYNNGTSMAVPHVSAVAALVWSCNPTLSNAQIRDALQKSAKDLGAVGKDDSYGYGLVQARATLDYLGCGSASSAPVVVITSPAPGANIASADLPITFSGTATDANGINVNANLTWTASGLSLGTGGSFTAYLNDGSHTIVASATDANGTGSASIAITVGSPSTWPTLDVTVAADKGAYVNRETVTITAMVTAGGSPVGGATVHLDLTTATDGRLARDATSGPDGRATFTYKVNSNRDGVGTYTAAVTATKSGSNPGSISTTFEVTK